MSVSFVWSTQKAAWYDVFPLSSAFAHASAQSPCSYLGRDRAAHGAIGAAGFAIRATIMLAGVLPLQMAALRTCTTGRKLSGAARAAPFDVNHDSVARPVIVRRLPFLSLVQNTEVAGPAGQHARISHKTPIIASLQQPRLPEAVACCSRRDRHRL